MRNQQSKLGDSHMVPGSLEVPSTTDIAAQFATHEHGTFDDDGVARSQNQSIAPGSIMFGGGRSSIYPA